MAWFINVIEKSSAFSVSFKCGIAVFSIFDNHLGLPSFIILYISLILGENGFSKVGLINFLPLKWSDFTALGTDLHIERNKSPKIINMPNVIFFVIVAFCHIHDFMSAKVLNE